MATKVQPTPQTQLRAARTFHGATERRGGHQSQDPAGTADSQYCSRVVREEAWGGGLVRGRASPDTIRGSFQKCCFVLFLKGSVYSGGGVSAKSADMNH